MNTAAPLSVPAAGDTRRTILRTARELIQTRSYLGLSFQELADRVGIRKASLYHHFASKEALGIAVIERSAQQFQQWQQHQAGLAPNLQLLSYVAMFRDLIGAGERVCPGGAMGPGWDCIEPGLQQAVRHMHQQHLDWLAQVAARCPLPDGLSPKQWGAHVSSVCHGALLTSRFHGSTDHFDDATAPLVAQLKALG